MFRSFGLILILGVSASGGAGGDLAASCVSAAGDMREALRTYLGDREATTLHAALGRVEEYRTCLGTASVPERAVLLNHETYLLLEARRFDDLRLAFEHLDGLYEQFPERREMITLYQRRAYFHDLTGRLAEAHSDYLRAVDLVRDGAPHVRIEILLDLADFLSALGDDTGAERVFEQARHEIEAAKLDSDVSDLRISMQEGRLNIKVGDLLHTMAALAATDTIRDSLQLAAIYMGRRADEIINSPLAGDGASYSSFERDRLTYGIIARTSLSRFLLPTGSLVEADSLAREALRYALPSDNEQLIIPSHIALGRVLAAREEIWGAHDAFSQALRMAEQREDAWYIQNIYRELGQLIWLRGRAYFPDAAALAESYLRKAVALAESRRAALRSRSISMHAFTAWQAPYRHLAILLAELERPQEALQVIDLSQGRYLDILRQQASIALASDQDRVRMDSLETELVRESARIVSGAYSFGERQSADARMSQIESEMDAIAPLPLRQPVDVAHLQSALRDSQRLLVNYVVGDSISYAIISRDDVVVATRLDIGERALRMLVAGVLPARDAPGGQQAEVKLDILHTLYNSIWRPIEGLVGEMRSVTVIPDGPLSGFPFAMLVTSQSDRFDYGGAEYLVYRHAITSELAASLTMAKVDAAHGRASVVALGRSNYGLAAVGAGEEGEVQVSLPHAAAEVRRVGRRFGHSAVLVDQSATKHALFDALSEANIVHVAAHAVASTASPLTSALYLAPHDGDDGILRWFELRGRRAKSGMVVLSACETAVGNARGGEGLLGLQYAFRAAGVATTLATMWQVDDLASMRLMDHFYRYLASGNPVDVALQQAQIRYLSENDGLRSSPFFWAGPVLSGPAQSFPPYNRIYTWIWLFIGLVLIAAASLVVRVHYPRVSYE